MRIRRLVQILAVGLFLAATTLAANAAVIRSWDANNEDGGDLFSSGTSDFEYGTLRAELESAGHIVLPGVATLTPANLHGVDVFFHGRSGNGAPTRLLSPSEASAINQFVALGGCVIVEANSAASEQDSGNSMLSALGLGAPFNGTIGGINDATGGTFANVITHTTVGPFGDLRGQNFGTSINADITPGTGTVVGTNTTIRTLVEFHSPPTGYVLAAGDPYGFGLFQNPSGGLFNVNDQNMYLNFISQCGRPHTGAPAMSFAGLFVLSTLILGAGCLSLWRRSPVA